MRPRAALLYVASPERVVYGLAVDTKGITTVARNSPIAFGWCTTRERPRRLPKSVHGRAKAAIKEITEAENKAHREGHKGVLGGVRGEVAQGGERIAEDEEALLATTTSGRALAAPADHQPDRVAVRPREGEDQPHEGAGLEGGRLGDDLQADGGPGGRWRKLNGAHLVALVRAGPKFENGELVREAKRGRKVAALRKYGRRRSPSGLTRIHKGRGSAFQVICRPQRSSSPCCWSGMGATS